MTAEVDRVDALTAQLDTSMRVEQQVNALLARLEATSSRLNTFVLPAEPAADKTPPDVAAAAGRTAAEAKVLALEANVAVLEATPEPAKAAVQAAAGAKAEVAVAASRAGEAAAAAKAELVEAVTGAGETVKVVVVQGPAEAAAVAKVEMAA